MLTNVLIIIGGCLGALGTYQLQKLGWSPVAASCTLGLLGVVIAQWMQQEDLAMIIFAGSFIGMTTVSVASFPLILFAGVICGALYILLEPYFDGYGGKLGALAFISLLIVMTVKKGVAVF